MNISTHQYMGYVIENQPWAAEGRRQTWIAWPVGYDANEDNGARMITGKGMENVKSQIRQALGEQRKLARQLKA